jgi:hypothetical protein
MGIDGSYGNHLISFTERPSAIRIISARLATRREREDYEQEEVCYMTKLLEQAIAQLKTLPDDEQDAIAD